MDSQLDNLVSYTLSNVPYYVNNIEFYGRDFSSFPILSKSYVLSNRMDFLSKEYLLQYKQGGLLIKTTSGTTGHCMNVFWSKTDDALANLSVWRLRKKWYNISITDKMFTFHTTAYRNNQLVNEEMYLHSSNSISFNKKHLTPESIPTLIELFTAFRPSWILTQPSTVEVLLSLVSPRRLKTMLASVKYIELTGEYFSPSLRKKLADDFPHIICKNMYGTTETNTVALECPCGELHIIGSNVNLEIIGHDNSKVNNGDVGNIILTSKKNTTMPLLRYEIGDLGSIALTRCSCGSKNQILRLHSTRKSEYIRLNGGRIIPAYVVVSLIESVNFEFNYIITRFQISQTGEGSININLQINKNFETWRNSVCSALRSRFYTSTLKDIFITFDQGPFNNFGNKNRLFTSIY